MRAFSFSGPIHTCRRHRGRGLLPAVLLASVALPAAAGQAEDLAARYPPAPVEMVLRQVSPHVYYVQGEAGAAFEHEGFISNAGVIVTPRGVVVIDALGTPSLAAMLVQRIREVTDRPIVRVITTHYHADHIYGLQVFRELGAEIWAPAGAREYLDSEQARERLEERRFSLEPWVNERTRLVPPDRLIVAQTRVEMDGIGLTLTPVGQAHSDGDLTVYVEPDRVLFSGDIIFEGRIAYLGDADTRRWLQALERMETAGVAALIPGHGPAAEDPGAAITQTRRYLSYVREQMGRAVAELIPFDEAYAATDWSEFEHLPAFEAANRRNAYQVYLSLEQEGFEETAPP